MKTFRAPLAVFGTIALGIVLALVNRSNFYQKNAEHTGRFLQNSVSQMDADLRNIHDMPWTFPTQQMMTRDALVRFVGHMRAEETPTIRAALEQFDSQFQTKTQEELLEGHPILIDLLAENPADLANNPERLRAYSKALREMGETYLPAEQQKVLNEELNLLQHHLEDFEARQEVANQNTLILAYLPMILLAVGVLVLHVASERRRGNQE